MKVHLIQWAVTLRNGEIHALFTPHSTETESAIACAVALYGKSEVKGIENEGKISQSITDEHIDMAAIADSQEVR